MLLAVNIMARHAIVLIMMLISLEFSILLIICLVLWVCRDYWSNSWVHWPLTDTNFIQELGHAEVQKDSQRAAPSGTHVY